jgi:hypothetical protein
VDELEEKEEAVAKAPLLPSSTSDDRPKQWGWSRTAFELDEKPPAPAGRATRGGVNELVEAASGGECRGSRSSWSAETDSAGGGPVWYVGAESSLRAVRGEHRCREESGRTGKITLLRSNTVGGIRRTVSREVVRAYEPFYPPTSVYGEVEGGSEGWKNGKR